MSNSRSVKSLVEKLNGQNRSQLKPISKWLSNQFINRLSHIKYGQLTLIDGEQKIVFEGQSRNDLSAEIRVLDAEFYWFIAFGGSIGAGEAYIHQFWQTPDLTKVIQVFAVNQAILADMDSGLSLISAPFKKMFHWFNKNTLKGSKNNIIAHYDLGNDFFESFLDPTMMYSAGIFYQEKDSMQQASINKLKTICEQLRLTADDHILEIGTGWGGFAIYAAQNYGCKVTTTTISEEQYAYTKNEIESLGLTDKICLLKEDYRKLEGQFDKLISIEMIEAVGYEFYDTFFKKCSHLLKENGELLIQSITISDQNFNRAKKEVDFIKRYIFPGGCLPSINAINQSITSATDLRVHHLKDIGIHYAQTLQQWREAFFEKTAQIKSQGFEDDFIRLWNFYLCYCEGAFRERVISTIQLHMVKPLARVPMIEKEYCK